MRFPLWLRGGGSAALFLAGAVGLSAAVIPVTDPALLAGLSAYNWICQTGAVSTTVNGASLHLEVRGSHSLSLQVATDQFAGLAPGRLPVLAWSVNGGAVQVHQLVAGETLFPLVTNTPDPAVELYVRGGSPFEDRFRGAVPPNSVRITGLVADDGAALLRPTDLRPVWLNIGDSILSGDGAAYAAGQGRPPDDGWAASDDGRASYGWLLANHFGYRESRIAYGGYDWGGGMAGVPGLAKLIDQTTADASRLRADVLSPLPAVVLINLGENGTPSGSTVTNALAHLRRRLSPATTVLVMIPVAGRGRAEITAAVLNYQTATGDAALHLVDLGPLKFATCDGQHPTAAGHQTIYEAALSRLASLVPPVPASMTDAPFWRASIITNEPVLFVQEADQPMATARLAFTPTVPPQLTFPDQLQRAEPGRDYVWEPGARLLTLTTNSRLPFRTGAELAPPPGSPHTMMGVLFYEGRYFHDLQCQVSYPHGSTWPASALPSAATNVLPRTRQRLAARQPVKIVALGDSITEGYNASGFRQTLAPPFQPPYPELLADLLTRRFAAPVAVANLGRAGTQAGWGRDQVARVAAEHPDLVVLAFGMNHSEPAPNFAKTMSVLLADVQAACPAAEVILVAPMTGNPKGFPPERFTAYRDALRDLANRPQVALADVTTPWLELLQRKPFADLSGNHINHPNDFGHRLYADVIGELLR